MPQITNIPESRRIAHSTCYTEPDFRFTLFTFLFPFLVLYIFRLYVPSTKISAIPDPTEPRPELQRRQAIDIPEAADASRIIGDISDRVEDVSTGVIEETDSEPPPSRSQTTEEKTSSVEQPTQPLNTIFTPSKDCTGDDALKTRITSTNVFVEMDDGAKKESCYPSAYIEYQYEPETVYYSPGVCPLSYVYASTSVSTHVNSPDTTFAKCCPSGITTLLSGAWSCRKTVTTDATVVLSSGSEITVRSMTFFANPILVAWQVSDISHFSPQSEVRAALESAGVTLPPQLSTASSTTDETSHSTSNTKDEDGDPDNDGGGLSTGAAAGIGVAIGLVGIMIMVAMWWFTKRYKVTRRTRNVGESGQSWVQQIYQVPDTATKPDEVVDTSRSAL